MNNLLVGVVVHGSDTNILLSNPEAADILGLTNEQMSGKKTVDPAWNFVHEDSTIMKVEDYPASKVFSTKKPLYDYVIGISRPDRDYVTWVIVNAIPVFSDNNELEKVVVNFFDITSHKQGGAALRESEERFRAAFDSAQDCVLIWDKEYNYLYANQAAVDHVGTTPDQVIGKNIRDGLGHVPEFMRLWMSRVDKVFETGEKLRVQDEQEMEGRQYHTDSILTPIRDTVGKVISVCVVYRDVTELKLAEAAIQEKAFLLDSSSAIIGTCDLGSRMTYVNAAFLNHLGFDTLGEVLGRPFTEFWMVQERFEEIMTALMGDGGPGQWTGELKVKRKDGSLFDTHISAATIYDNSGEPTGLMSTSIDITERKRAEEEKKKLETQLQRAQKMEAMGLMAGGIAHDLNNILSGIVSYPELLLMDLPEDSPMWKPIKTIQESGMRAADVVEDLMTIARGVATSKEVMNFNTVVEEYLNSTEHRNLVSIRPSVTFKTRFDSDLLNVNGSPTHMKKVLMNLVTNASEAIESSGTVIISTMNQYLDEPLRGYEDVVTGEYVMLAISDDGLGISQQDLERIFEPFYTKKVMDRSGTGLGLAVVWNTVQDHKGYINVKSSEKGTVFELYFPVTREELAAEKEEVPPEDIFGAWRKNPCG